MGRTVRRSHGSRVVTKQEKKDFYEKPAWARLKARYYAENEKACFACGGANHVDLHHCTYERFGGMERLGDMLALCRHHHVGKAGVHGLHARLKLIDKRTTLEEASQEFILQCQRDRGVLPDALLSRMAADALYEDWERFNLVVGRGD